VEWAVAWAAWTINSCPHRKEWKGPGEIRGLSVGVTTHSVSLFPGKTSGNKPLTIFGGRYAPGSSISFVEGAPMKAARRFLLAPSLARLIARERGVERQIVEGYLSAKSGSGENQFVRLEADECHLVLPLLGSAGEVVEDLAPLPRSHAKALFDLSVGQIAYDQLHVPIPSDLGQRTLLDRINHPGHCDVITVEFDDQQQAEAFEVPLWFGPEVTNEDAYERRHIALNGVPSDPETTLSGLQLEQVLDLLEQAKPTSSANSNTAAHEVVAALARSLEAAGVVKAISETTAPASEQPTAEEFAEPAERIARQA
jgi:CYTH domain-containing protein